MCKDVFAGGAAVVAVEERVQPASTAIQEQAGRDGQGAGGEDKCKLFDMRIPQMVKVITI